MRTLSLHVNRFELHRLLMTLSRVRRQRFRKVLPVWLHFDPVKHLLTVEEERAQASGAVDAHGSWPQMGATVDLHFLKRATGNDGLPDEIELIAGDEAIFIPFNNGHLKMNLLPFGPRNVVSRSPAVGFSSHAILPLFRWARDRGE